MSQEYYDRRQAEQLREARIRAEAASLVRGGPTAEGILRAARKRYHAEEGYRPSLVWPIYDESSLFSEAEKKLLREAKQYPLRPERIIWMETAPTPDNVIRERRRENLLKDLRHLAEEEPAELRQILMQVFVVTEPDGNPAPDPSAPLAAPAAGNGVRLAA